MRTTKEIAYQSKIISQSITKAPIDQSPHLIKMYQNSYKE